ncbi:MAG: C40 family peptidase [Deltaproteobacteria bacterium]|nr:C40 family peptidase [Deltaproteobacteria bacterium]
MKGKFDISRRFFLFPVSFFILMLFFYSACTGATKGVGGSHPQLGKKILKTAKSQIGKKYCFGGRSPKKGFDCSGLAWWSHKMNGINIPRQSWDQYGQGKKISRKNLKPGDLLYFETYKKGASHVGIYDGKGGFIHSPSSGKKVQRTSLSDSYYKKRYLGARRFW